jgi:hypothetical protein
MMVRPSKTQWSIATTMNIWRNPRGVRKRSCKRYMRMSVCVVGVVELAETRVTREYYRPSG